MDTRNLVYNAHSTVDMEIDHPVYGWIPFTASPNDPEQIGKDLYAEAIAGTLGVIAAYVAPPPDTSPQPTAFAQAIKVGVGGILAANALAVAYPLFFDAVSLGNWPDVQALILDAQQKGMFSPTQYAEFQAAVIEFRIPVVLP